MEKAVFQSIDMIEARIQEKLTVQSIADNVHFSKYHYQRMFREIVGESVMEYVTRRKLSLAGRELLESGASILEVALKFGYDSHEGFTRSFKAYMGVTPRQYRKYHLGTISQTIPKEKEKCEMLYKETTDEMLRELNGWLAQAKEAAAYAGKYGKGEGAGAEVYAPFWAVMADKADAMAEGLRADLECIAAIGREPDEISARFRILKAMDEMALQANLAAFHAGLMTARARQEHRAQFLPICRRFEELADSARMKAGRVSAFLHELTDLIFEDMRQNAGERIEAAIARGRKAAQLLEAAEGPYGYIVEELQTAAEELAELPIARASVSGLEDIWTRMQIVLFAAETDAFRDSGQKEAFAYVGAFCEKISETAEFFQSLPEDAGAQCTMENRELTENETNVSRTKESMEEVAFGAKVLLFYMKGELEKLGRLRPEALQDEDFKDVCCKLEQAAFGERTEKKQMFPDENPLGEITEILAEARKTMEKKAEKLGPLGSAIHFLAEKAGQLSALADSRYKPHDIS